MCKYTDGEERVFWKKVISGRSEGTGQSCCSLNLGAGRPVPLPGPGLCLQGWWGEKPLGSSVGEKGHPGPLFTSPLPLPLPEPSPCGPARDFPGHWQYLAIRLPTTQWSFKFKWWTSGSGDAYFPDPATNQCMCQGIRLPTWTDSLTRKKKKKGKKMLYFKNNRKAIISCENLLPLTKFIQERDSSVIGFLESVLGSSL